MAAAMLAEQANAAGNAAYKAGKYREAASHYTDAIEADRSVAKYWTNRANSFWKEGMVRDVLADASAAIQLDPKWLKGHYFRGLALERLGRFSEAVQSLQAALELELSQQVAAALHRCQESLRQQRAWCKGQLDPLTQLVRKNTIEVHNSLKLALNIPHNRISSTTRIEQLLKAYAAVIKGDELCAAAAAAAAGDLEQAKSKFAEAAQQYQIAADSDCAAAHFNLAQLTRLGLFDMPSAGSTSAANSSYAVAHMSQGMCQDLVLELAQGVGDFKFIMMNVGAADCGVLAGDLHRDGLFGTAGPNLQEALRCYSLAARPSNTRAYGHNPAAQAALGSLKAVQGALAAAQQWYQKAANQKYSWGELGLAQLLTRNDDEASNADKRKALDLALSAAEHGLPRAKTLAGTLEEDEGKAAALLQQAVEEDGHPECLLALAMGYAHGWHGLPSDHPKARQLLLQAALEEGWPEALDILGNAYAAGFWGFETSPSKALAVFERAAHLGVQPAMYKTAGAYVGGIGTPASLSKAKHWAQLALEAAVDAGAKADAQKMLGETQSKLQQFGEESWRSMVKMNWEMMNDGHVGAAMAESLSRDPDIPEDQRSTYSSFMKAVAQQASTQSPAAAGTSSASSSSSGAATAAPQQQQQLPAYPSAAAFARLLGLQLTAEQGRRRRTEINGFFSALDTFKLAGELQRQQQANELRIRAIELVIGLVDWELAIKAFAAGYMIEAATMGIRDERVQKQLMDAALVYNKRHPNQPDGQILYDFLEATKKGLPWLFRRLAGVIPKVANPVLRGYLLLARSQMTTCFGMSPTEQQWQEALDDAEAGLLLLPRHPDLLFMRAWAINAVKYNPLCAQPVDLSRKHSRQVQQQLARRQAAAAETAAAYQLFLDAAPEVHRNKPAALYYLAYIPLNENMVTCEPGTPAANVINKSQALYDMGRAAEAQLPATWLPVCCAVRDKVPMYLATRRLTASDWVEGSASNGTTGSGSSRSMSSSSAAPATSRVQDGCSSAHSTQSSSSSSNNKPGEAEDSEGGSSSKGKGKSKGSSKGSCAGCGAVDVKVRKCSGCQQVAYCNRDCQTAHWKEHKKACKKADSR